MGKIRWTHAALSDVGRLRSGNEDAVFAEPKAGVFVVADGMGGHAAGEVASAIATRAIGARLCSLSATCSLQQARGSIHEAFVDAGDQIVQEARENPAHEGMGTTATVLVLGPEDRYVVGHIGDSRGYLFRDGELRQITRDHSWVQEQVDRGAISREQARFHPQSNIITRALGTAEIPWPDVYDGQAKPGDIFLVASDGLTDMLPEERIAEILRSGRTPKEMAVKLVDEANLAGGIDNITVLVVAVEEAS
ncbi:MAG: Stp1/IreP family PP2C-type Ser/Thr phosphatase [Gemmatimonadota bacterium]